MEKTNPDVLMTLLLLKDGREVADGVSGERDQIEIRDKEMSGISRRTSQSGSQHRGVLWAE